MRMRRSNPVLGNDIGQFYMKHRDEEKATEQDLIDLLKSYNLKDGLILLGKTSKSILMDSHRNRLGQVAYIDKNTGSTISQPALAYLANILLISRANDYKSKYIGQYRDNLAVLCNSYINCLIRPEYTQEHDLVNFDRFRSYMVRTYFEQKQPFQFSPWYMIARTLVIFGDLITSIEPDVTCLEPLPVIFQRETGLSLYDYLRLCFVIFTATGRTATFSISKLIDADLPHLKELLVVDKLTKFLDILSADYGRLRGEDNRMNENLDPIYTAARFNPLSVYPIVETQKKYPGDPYVVPNIMLYIRKAYGGLYWWFHRYFEDHGKRHRDFRTYFGDVFQEYVGTILRGVYGAENVHGEISYGRSSKFIDWWVERDDRIYLFEVKAYQFALFSAQTGDRETVIGNEMRKIAEAIDQVYRRIQDIQNYDELQIFRQKRVVPFIVFMDIPYISSDMFEPWIEERLAEIEQGEGINRDFPIFLMDIKELEFYDEAVDVIELEDIFLEIRNDKGKSIMSVLWDLKGRELRNRYLDSFFEDFKASLMGQ